MKETTVSKRWTYKGKDCVILLMNELHHYNMYVESKHNIGYSEHHDHSLSPESCIDCHGGVTFAGPLNGIEDAKPWYFGADFAHYGDRISLPNGINVFDDGHAWTLEEVEKECERFADSVIEYEKNYKKILDIIKRHEEEIEQLKKNQ